MATQLSPQEIERRRKQSLDAKKMARSSVPAMPVSNVGKTVAEQYASGNRDTRTIGGYKNTSINGYDNAPNTGNLSQTAMDAQKRNELAYNKSAPTAEQFAANNAKASTVGEAAASGVTDQKVIGSYGAQTKPPLEFGGNVATPNITNTTPPSTTANSATTPEVTPPTTTSTSVSTPTTPTGTTTPTTTGTSNTSTTTTGTTTSTTGQDTSTIPGVAVYDQATQNAQDVLTTGSEFAVQDQAATEENLRRKFLAEIGDTNLDEKALGQNINLNAMSFQELQNYAQEQGFTVDDNFKKQIQAQGASAIDDMKYQLNQELAINDLTARQVERQRDRALDEREKFNTMQDVKNRALLGSFGIQDVASNGAVLQELDNGQRAKEDLVLQFADKLTPISMNAQSLIRNYNSNVAQVEAQGAKIIEDKYAEIVGKLQEYADQGVTSKKELRKAMLTEMKDYGKLIGEINDKKLKYIQDENKNMFDQSKFLIEQQSKEDDMYMKNFGVMFKDGVPLLDAQGQQIPTLDNMKFQNELDQSLTMNTGYIYKNGAPMLDSKGNQVSTFSLNKFNAENARADRAFGLDQQKLAIEMADKGIVQVQKNMVDPSSGINPEKSQYGMSITADGSVAFNIPANGKAPNGRGQCGEFVNDALGLSGNKKFTNNITEKESLINSQVPVEGGAFIQRTGNQYGHVGIVTKVYPDGSFDFVDSNRKGNETIASGHMDANYKGRGVTGFTTGVQSGGVGYEKNTTSSNSALSKIPKEYLSSVTQKAGAFDNEQGVKNYQVALDARNFVRSLPNDTKNPSDDQALIYAFAKVMDPASSVREGEYATVQKYAQSWANQYGSSLNQAISGTGFLTTEARKNIKETLENKYGSQKKSYDSLLNQYTQNIDNMAGTKGIGKEILQDYSMADTSFVRPGFVRGYDKDGNVYDIPESDSEAINQAMTEGVSFGS